MENKSAVPGSGPHDARSHLVEALTATGEQDREAFRRVYRLTSSKLFGVCLRICGDRQAAEDVLQEVYVLIWRRAGAYDPLRSSPITWLATIARNRAIDWRRQHPPVVIPTEGPAADPADETPNAAETMLLDEADRDLHRCLDELERGERDNIRSAFFDGLSYGELARRAALPLGTMKSRMRRGLARLRRCLDHD